MIVRKAILLLKGGQHFCTEKNAILLLLAKILLVKGGLHFCTEKKCHPSFSNKIQIINKKASNVSENAHHLLLLKSYYCNHLHDNNVQCHVK